MELLPESHEIVQCCLDLQDVVAYVVHYASKFGDSYTLNISLEGFPECSLSFN